MPQLLLRQLPRELVTAVRDYARAHGLSTTEAGAALLARGLDHVRQQEARTAGAKLTNAVPSAERQARASRAAAARWAARRGPAST